MESSQALVKINYQFKFLYAIGIVIIVAGHCNYGGINIFYDWFPPYSFHLGLFVFSSGYFYSETSEQKPYKFIRKKLFKLILPLYLYNFVYAFLVGILKNVGMEYGEEISPYSLFWAPLYNGHQFQFNQATWFIVPLFMVQIFNLFFNVILNRIGRKKRNDWLTLAVYFVFGGCAVFAASKGYNTGAFLVLDRFCFFLPFYQLGIVYKKHIEIVDKVGNALYFLILFVIQLVLFTIYNGNISFVPSWCQDFDRGIFLPYIVGITGIAFWLRVARILQDITQKSAWINIIANNTFSIMVNQFLGFWLVNVVYAMLHKYTGMAYNFDMEIFKNNLSYFYMPRNLQQWRIVYLVAGIIVPLIIQWGINKEKKLYFYIRKNKYFNLFRRDRG